MSGTRLAAEACVFERREPREDNLSGTIRTVAAVFPIKRLFLSLAVAYDPATTGTAVRWSDVLVLLAWGLGGLLLASRFFRWQPHTG